MRDKPSHKVELSELPDDLDHPSIEQRLALFDDASILLRECIARLRVALKNSSMEQTAEYYLIPEFIIRISPNHSFLTEDLSIADLKEMLESDPDSFCPNDGEIEESVEDENHV